MKNRSVNIVVSNGTILTLVKFKVQGNIRFLSHSETISVFERACIRAGIRLKYSEGFNPRPKLSLPLPRSVGVESEDEILCLRLAAMQSIPSTDSQNPKPSLDTELLKANLTDQLPAGIEIVSVTISKAKKLPQPSAAMYVLSAKPEYADEQLKTRIERTMTSKSLNLDRQINAKSAKYKNVDVRGFLKSIEFDNNRVIVVECKISSAGTIRVDEILNLLGLDNSKLAAPIKRKNIQWQANGL